MLLCILVLHILVAPYNVEIAGMRRHSYGSDIELTCTSEGGPQLEYNWMFVDQEVGNYSMLNISNANASNGGDYACNVTNVAGYATNTTTVYSE